MSKPKGHREYLLAELRAASARSRLVTLEIDAIGESLKAGVLDEDQTVMTIIAHGLVGWFSPQLEGALKDAQQQDERRRYEGK